MTCAFIVEVIFTPLGMGNSNCAWDALWARRHFVLALALVDGFLFGAGELGGAGGALQGCAAAWGVGECDVEFLERLRRIVLFEE